jgi:colanic acid/amylovoran biosynthesis glycosyltransferase
MDNQRADHGKAGLHVLVVGGNWPPETFLARLYRGLCEAGVQVSIAGSVPPNHSWMSQPNFRWIPRPAFHRRSLRRRPASWARSLAAVARAPRQSWRLAQLAAEGAGFKSRLYRWNRLFPFLGEKPDVIYFPWNSAAIANPALFHLGCPVVISCRGSQINIAPHDPDRPALTQQLRTTLEAAAAVHCVSEAIKGEASQYGLDPYKARVIRPAVDPQFFVPAARMPPGRAPFQVVSTGTLNWHKGHEYALLAVRRLVDDGLDVRYHLVGGGPEKERVLYTIADLELESHVVLHGKLSAAGVRDILQQSHVFLLPSLSEGIANAALEAMACGMPVVSTDCGGMREAIADGVEGVIVPVRDPGAIAGALKRLIAEPALANRLGEAARRKILQSFSLDSHIHEWVDLFQSVAECPARGVCAADREYARGETPDVVPSSVY